MADEFAKGFGILSIAGLLWLILAGNYRTPSFGGRQLTGAVPEDPTTFEAMGIVFMDAMFWFMILGTLTFWVLIPAGREVRGYVEARYE